MAKKDLTHLQQNFLNNLMKGMNQKDAYIKAGYKARGKAAENHASRLVCNGRFAAELKKAVEKAADKAEISQERILREEKRLAFIDPIELVDGNGKLLGLHELPVDIRRAIQGLEIITLVDGSLKYKYKFSDKGRSLERLERHLGMFEKDNEQGAPVIILKPGEVIKPDDTGLSADS